MSEVRQKLADAASRVDGVNVTPYFRQTTKPGQGMVRLDRMTRSANGFGFMNTWQIIILLPADIAAAERWLENNTSDLVHEIEQELILLSVTPQQLALDSGTIPVVIIEGNREQE